MSMRPLISIVVPIYNVEKYLERCLNSLIQQTLKSIEIILVDDESPDNCPQLCDKYAEWDSRIKVIHKKNEGLGFARNSGMQIATGEYITFVDSDDFVALDTYERLYSVAKLKDLDICYFRFCRYYEDGTIKPMNDWNKEEYFLTKNDVQKFFLEMVGPKPEEKIDIKYSMSVCKAIFKLDILKVNNLQFVSERNVASEDLIFHLDLAPYINKIGYLPMPYYYYYVNPSSISTSYSEEKYQRLLKLAKIVQQRLSLLYLDDIYIEHYCSQLLRIYKVILKFESINPNNNLIQKLYRIKDVCDNPILRKLYDKQIYRKYSIKNRIFILCMKYGVSLFFILSYNFKALQR